MAPTGDFPSDFAARDRRGVISGCGGIVLCGGSSIRMGRDKASLPFGRGTMLETVVETLREVVGPVCVIATPGQRLPKLPADVLIGWDAEEGKGPIAGLRAGLKLLRTHVGRAFCGSCDAPLLKGEVVRLLEQCLGEQQAAAPHDGKYWSPLCGVYRTELVELIERGEPSFRSPTALLQAVRGVPVSLEAIRQVDPELRSLWNLNTPEEYAAALAMLNQEQRPNPM